MKWFVDVFEGLIYGSSNYIETHFENIFLVAIPLYLVFLVIGRPGKRLKNHNSDRIGSSLERYK